jgi:thiamine biosynthesis lipoprotein
MILVVSGMSNTLQSHFRQWLFCLLGLLLLAACGGETTPVKLSGSSMGTTWHVSYIATPGIPDDVKLHAGIDEQLERVNRSMSTYRPDSELSQISAAPIKTWITPSPDFFLVLTTALDVGSKSEGAYDVTVAPLVNLWGFGPDPAITEPPPEEKIRAAMSRVGQNNLRVDTAGHRVMKLSELSLDFSSLAKGYAVDKAADWLLSQGVTRFVVEVGGEMRLSGVSGRDDPWRIAIEQPEPDNRSVAVTIHITDAGVATSGDYRNYFEYNGKRYSHEIDPRTGWPVAHDLVSVTVVHPSCMLADAWATALTVLGPDEAMKVAQAQGLAVYFIRRSENGFVHSHTPLFSRYLENPQR